MSLICAFTASTSLFIKSTNKPHANTCCPVPYLSSPYYRSLLIMSTWNLYILQHCNKTTNENSAFYVESARFQSYPSYCALVLATCCLRLTTHHTPTTSNPRERYYNNNKNTNSNFTYTQTATPPTPSLLYYSYLYSLR
jgi:hypothetical protein